MYEWVHLYHINYLDFDFLVCKRNKTLQKYKHTLEHEQKNRKRSFPILPQLFFLVSVGAQIGPKPTDLMEGYTDVFNNRWRCLAIKVR